MDYNHKQYSHFNHKQEMTLEVLISTMHQKDLSLFQMTNCKSNVLIINQTDYEGYTEEYINGYKVRMISTRQRGLSRSRNMALIHAEGDICLICDDSELLEDNHVDIILSAFKRNPLAHIIAFDLCRLDYRSKVLRNHFKKEGPAPRFSSFQSPSLAFRRDDVLKKMVYFDIRLGAGSGFISAGEEGAWQNTARKRGLKIYRCPSVIAKVEQKGSTWFTGYNEKYFYDLGANLHVNYPICQYVFMFYYLYRLRKDTTLSKMTQLRWLVAGMQGFDKGYNYDNYLINKGIV